MPFKSEKQRKYLAINEPDVYRKFKAEEQDMNPQAARMMQNRGEGLASINSQEAGLLSALGGAGEPLPGTQGMGPDGGPIRSYVPWYVPILATAAVNMLSSQATSGPQRAPQEPVSQGSPGAAAQYMPKIPMATYRPDMDPLIVDMMMNNAPPRGLLY